MAVPTGWPDVRADNVPMFFNIMEPYARDRLDRDWFHVYQREDVWSLNRHHPPGYAFVGYKEKSMDGILWYRGT